MNSFDATPEASLPRHFRAETPFSKSRQAESGGVSLGQPEPGSGAAVPQEKRAVFAKNMCLFMPDCLETPIFVGSSDAEWIPSCCRRFSIFLSFPVAALPCSLMSIICGDMRFQEAQNRSTVTRNPRSGWPSPGCKLHVNSRCSLRRWM